MKVDITYSQLVKLRPKGRRACSAGLNRFAARFPLGIHVEEWTLLHSIWAARKFMYWQWLVDRGLLPTLDARGEDLRGVELDLLRVGPASAGYADFTGALVNPGQALPEGWCQEKMRMKRCT